MTKILMSSVTLFLVAVTMAAIGLMTSAAQAHVDVHIGVAIPPPPAVVYEQEPEVVLVPRTRVYYTANPDYDLYRYGNYWYVNRDGYWYRSNSYRGPFGPIVYERVPRPIIAVPGTFHHYPIHPSNWHRSSASHHGVAHHGPPHHAAHHSGHHHGEHH